MAIAWLSPSYCCSYAFELLCASGVPGAAQADAALLLIDGSPGGFEAGFGEAKSGSGGGGGGRAWASLRAPFS